jgi:hypothetical protein
MLSYRGVKYELAPAMSIRVGDKIVCFLSDAVAAVKVTAIRFHEYDFGPDLPPTATIFFEWQAGPWWVDKCQMAAKPDERYVPIVKGPHHNN